MLYDEIQDAVAFIRTKTELEPETGIILGTGLSRLAEDIDVDVAIPYEKIPHFPVSTVQSHKGELILGHLSGKPVIAMAGRFHYYEGYSMEQVTFPVRVMKFLGIKNIFISSASGSTNENINAGDIVFLRDHINLQPENPLRGPNDERLGVRFPDMLYTYDRELAAQAMEIAEEHEIVAHTGVYVALTGPNLETPAEYNFLHRIGGDVVGMSTVPEVIVARHSELRVFVAAVVSNKCFPMDSIQPTTVESVIAIAEEAEPKLGTIIKELLNKL